MSRVSYIWESLLTEWGSQVTRQDLWELGSWLCPSQEIRWPPEGLATLSWPLEAKSS